MYRVLVFTVIFLGTNFAFGESCRDLFHKICPKDRTMNCVSKNMDNIPQNCLQDIVGEVATSHPCIAQIRSGKELSKKCKEEFSGMEARSKDFSKHCGGLNNCQKVYERIKDRAKADVEYQKCVEHESKNLSPECNKVLN